MLVVSGVGNEWGIGDEYKDDGYDGLSVISNNIMYIIIIL